MTGPLSDEDWENILREAACPDCASTVFVASVDPPQVTVRHSSFECPQYTGTTPNADPPWLETDNEVSREW